MLEDLLDHLFVLYKSEDSHLSLTPSDRLRTRLGEVKGSTFPVQVGDRLLFF
jgi:hypothetical protein